MAAKAGSGEGPRARKGERTGIGGTSLTALRSSFSGLPSSLIERGSP